MFKGNCQISHGVTGINPISADGPYLLWVLPTYIWVLRPLLSRFFSSSKKVTPRHLLTLDPASERAQDLQLVAPQMFAPLSFDLLAKVWLLRNCGKGWDELLVAGECGKGAPWLLCWLFPLGAADLRWDPAPRMLSEMLCSFLSRAVELIRADLGEDLENWELNSDQVDFK